MKKTPIGVQVFNAALQEALNPPAPAELRSFGTAYRIGDKVMQIRSNYKEAVFNGEIGIVSGIDHEESTLRMAYPGIDTVEYEESELGELVSAYATSIHKSQGLEYPVVVLLVHNQHFIMLQCNLVYTAITRGKRLVVLVGTKQALAIAIKNNKVPERSSYLAVLLREMTASRRLCGGKME
jgi:exodeoxyribonuclease V alpha subunit